MTLQAGLQILATPYFPPVTDWPARLRLSSGVDIRGDHAFAREPWREPTPEECGLLVRDADLPLPQADFDAALAVWSLPRRLVTLWWQLLEQTTPGRPVPEFDRYLLEVCDFLAFKNLLPRPGLRAEVVALPAGHPSLCVDPQTNQPAGLGWTSDLWGMVHLGDGPAEIHFLNHPVDLDADPSYPVVSLRLEPGEAIRLPATSLLLDAPAGPENPALWLLLRPQP